MAFDNSKQQNRHVIISQVPPPHHGSTIMTQVFLETVSQLGGSCHLVDRRFSASIEEVGKFRLKKLLAAVSLLIRLIWAQVLHRPQVYVLFITNRPASFIVDWVITEILRIFRCPLVNYVHTNGFSELATRNRLLNFLVRRALGSAHQTVCLSGTLENDITWAVKGRISIIPNTPYRIPSESPKKRSSHPTFLFLSNLIPEKGVERFVEAAISLATVIPAAEFVIAGDSPDALTLSLLKSKIEACGFKERISVLGRADEETKWSLLDKAHALVFPSTYRFEAQPLTIIEAMSRALPVIAFDTGGIKDLILDGRTGYLIKNKDSEALVAPMRRIAMDAELRERLGKQAAERFDQVFSRAAYSRSWARVLDIRYIGTEIEGRRPKQPDS